eukprot:gene15072-biopygen2389
MLRSAAQGKEIQAILQPDPARGNFLDIAVGPLATPGDLPAAVEDPPEVHKDPHAHPDDACGTPRDPPATPPSRWAAQGKEIQAILLPDPARGNFLDIAVGPLATPGDLLAAVEDARDPHAARGRARQEDTSNPAALPSIPQKPRRHLDGPRGPTRPPMVSPRAPRRQPEATARQPGIPMPPAAAQGKEIQAIRQPYPAFHRNLDGTSTAPAAPRDRR